MSGHSLRVMIRLQTKFLALPDQFLCQVLIRSFLESVLHRVRVGTAAGTEAVPYIVTFVAPI
jgi:hypothetical protein